MLNVKTYNSIEILDIFILNSNDILKINKNLNYNL